MKVKKAVATKTPSINQTLTTLPFSSLCRGKNNVRKIQPSKAYITSLAESIYYEGIKQNLVVSPQNPDSEETHYEINVGGCRFSALELLLEQKRIDENYLVPVKIEAVENATATSLTENFFRAPMHPLDAFVAFKAMVDEGKTVGEVATHFGTTEMYVKQRLTLASAAPELLECFKNDEMGFEQLMVLCQVDDHERQKQIWFSTPHHQSPSQLRKIIQGEAYTLDHRYVRFVGIEQYEKEGGSVQWDLFDDEDKSKSFITSPELINKLATEKLETIKKELESQGWGEVRLSFDHDIPNSYSKYYPPSRVMTDEEKAQHQAYGERIEEIENLLEETNDDEALKLNEEIEELEKKMGLLEESLTDMESVNPHLTVFVSINYSGNASIYEGYAEKATAVYLDKKADGEDVEIIKNEPEKKGYPAALQGYLAAVRTTALQAELLKRPEIGAVLMLHSLVPVTFNIHYYCDKYASISLERNDYRIAQHIEDVVETPAGKVVNECFEKWKARIPQNTKELLDFLLKLDHNELQELCALCVGSSLTAYMVDDKNNACYQQLAEIVPPNIRDYWQPEGENFFKRLNRNQMAEVMKEANIGLVGFDEKMKKSEWVALAEKQIKQTPDWIPEIMRF
ncbi:hypothetical protein MCAMS1_02868 [biofilm metagenome]